MLDCKTNDNDRCINNYTVQVSHFTLCVIYEEKMERPASIYFWSDDLYVINYTPCKDVFMLMFIYYLSCCM